MTNWIALQTLVRRELTRIFRIWPQTLIPPVITMTLYFVIFGNLIGPRIGNIGEYTYIEYIVPGLIMMSVITSSYANVVSSFFGAKFQRNIEELLIAPISNWVIIWGHVSGGMVRGLLVGILVTIVALFFTNLTIHHIGTTLIIVLLTSILFSLGGFINAIFARKFDDISIVPTFILTPLTYLGGVFYSITLLPTFWQNISLVNPILYMVNTFRYGLLGVTDIPVKTAITLVIGFTLLLYFFCLHLLNKGTGLRQ